MFVHHFRRAVQTKVKNTYIQLYSIYWYIHTVYERMCEVECEYIYECVHTLSMLVHLLKNLSKSFTHIQSFCSYNA